MVTVGDLCRDAIQDFLQSLLIFVLIIVSQALGLLLLAVDGSPCARGLFRLAQLGAFGLQVLLQRKLVDLVAEVLQFGSLGIELLLQLGKVPLEFVGCGNRGLKLDDGNLQGGSAVLESGVCAGRTAPTRKSEEAKTGRSEKRIPKVGRAFPVHWFDYSLKSLEGSPVASPAQSMCLLSKNDFGLLSLGAPRQSRQRQKDADGDASRN